MKCCELKAKQIHSRSDNHVTLLSPCSVHCLGLLPMERLSLSSLVQITLTAVFTGMCALLHSLLRHAIRIL
jgi:hypothetical protein